MQTSITNYNFLIVGKSGAGKSALTKLLTGNPEITVANSLKQVTTQANFYEGTSFPFQNNFVKFRILDVPGLDKINNRFVIRQKILKILQKQKISLNGIFYVSSLTQRDTVDNQKIFNFIQQLPWLSESKKNCLIPIFTKYDNLIIDCQDDEIRSTKLQYKQIFTKAGHISAWSKRIYWINHTKSLDFKMKTYPQIKITHQKQIQRLIQMIQRNKCPLTTKQIMLSIQKQQHFILQSLFEKMLYRKLPYKIQNKKYNLKAKIQIQSHKVSQSVTALSASSIGLFLAKVLQRQISTIYSVALMGLPIAMALLNLKSTNSVLHSLKLSQQSSGVQIIQTYEKLCNFINLEVENQWKLFNNLIELNVKENYLYCNITGKIIDKFKFIDTEKLMVSMDQQNFQYMNYQHYINNNSNNNNSNNSNNSNNKQQQSSLTQSLTSVKQIKQSFYSNKQNSKSFRIKIPQFQNGTIWQPVIQIQYGIKIFDENSILMEIQTLRQQYYHSDKL